MPISATGNKSEAGFSLVELLAVLAILSLMVGAVVLNLPEPRSETDRVTEEMTAQLTRFLDDGAVAGEVRALGPSEDGLSLFRHDGISWTQVADFTWPEAARIQLEQAGDVIELPEDPLPTLLFEPYGAVPDFTLTFDAREADYSLQADARGRIIRTVSR